MPVYCGRRQMLFFFFFRFTVAEGADTDGLLFLLLLLRLFFTPHDADVFAVSATFPRLVYVPFLLLLLLQLLLLYTFSTYADT